MILMGKKELPLIDLAIDPIPSPASTKKNKIEKKKRKYSHNALEF